MENNKVYSITLPSGRVIPSLVDPKTGEGSTVMANLPPEWRLEDHSCKWPKGS